MNYDSYLAVGNVNFFLDMCLLNNFIKYGTLFICCSKTAHTSLLETTLLANYEKCLDSLLQLTTARWLLSVYVDTVESCTPNFLQGILSLSNKYTNNMNSEITLALSLKNKAVLSMLEDLKFYSVNRVYVRPIDLINLCNKSELLDSFEKISHHYENFAVELAYNDLSNLQTEDNKQFLSNLKNSGVKHVTLEESGADPIAMVNNDKRVDASENYDHYQFMRESLEKFGFQQYELCNFSLHNYKSIQNASLWSGMQFLGIGPGAHSRIAINTLKPFERHAVFCSCSDLEFELKKSKLTKCEVLEELLFLGLKTTSGISNSLWELATAGNSLLHDFGKNEEVQQLQNLELLKITPDSMLISKNNLVLLNSVLVTLFKVLKSMY